MTQTKQSPIKPGRFSYMYDNGKGISEDDGKAVAYYQQACDGGSANGCAYLGIMYRDGAGISKDKEKALALFQQACDDGDAYGCKNLE